MAEVVWSEPAFEDLGEIYAYIARDSAKYAQLTLLSLREAAGRLAHFPQAGHRIPELPGTTYREFIEGAYRIVYRIAPNDRVFIVAVVHGARHMRRVLKGRG